MDDTTAPGTALAVISDPYTLPIGVAARIDQQRKARRLPYISAAVTCGAGWGGYGLGQLVGLAGGSDTLTVGGFAATATAAAGIAALYRRRIAHEWRWRWLAALAGSAAWVDVAAIAGPSPWWMSAVCAAGWAAVSARWMAEHSPERERVDVEPSWDDHDVAAVIERRWRTRVGCQGGVLSGSMLTQRSDHPHAVEWRVVTNPPGSVTFDRILGLRGNIAAALHYPIAKIILEPSDEDEGHAHLSVVTRDILAATVPYTGPRYRDGKIPVALYADGRGWADYVAFEEGTGVRSGCLSGDPGSGKSALAESIGLGLRSSGHYYVLFGDGDPEGRSSDLLLTEVSHWGAAGPQEVLAQLEAVEETLLVHGILLGMLTDDGQGGMKPLTDPEVERPCRFWRPCAAYPAVYWLLDELHRLVTDPWMVSQRFTARLEKVLRLCRKLGVGVCTGSQSLLAGDFGNSTQLRGYLSARNLFALRNSNRSESAVVAGLPISPSTLPKVGKGYAYTTGEGRLAMCRTAWSPNMHRYVPALPSVMLAPPTAQAVLRHRPARPADRAEALAQRRARLAEWMRGGGSQSTSGEGSAATRAAARWGGPIGALVGPSEAARRPADPATTTSAAPVVATETATAPSPAAGNSTALDAVYDAPDLDVALRRPSWRRTYEALVAGKRLTKDIAAHAALSLPATSNALRVLREQGIARKVGHGEHELGTAQAGAEDFDAA